jgi:hypothetical protein
MCLWVGREKEAIGGRHAVVGSVVGGRQGHEVAGSEVTSLSLFSPFMRWVVGEDPLAKATSPDKCGVLKEDYARKLLVTFEMGAETL